jgi:hypothetical protein
MARLVRKGAWKDLEGKLPLHIAYARGFGLVFLTLLGTMLVPLAFDMYRGIKNWFLATEEDQNG